MRRSTCSTRVTITPHQPNSQRTRLREARKIDSLQLCFAAPSQITPATLTTVS